MPKDYGKEIAARMPNGHFTVVPDSYHHVLLDNPTGLISALEQFFSKLSTVAAQRSG